MVGPTQGADGLGFGRGGDWYRRRLERDLGICCWSFQVLRQSLRQARKPALDRNVSSVLRATGVLLLVLLVLVVALAAGACKGKSREKGAAAPVATLGSAPLVDRDLAQFNRDVAALKGRVMVINFWASWCAPCKAETPALQRTAASFAGKPVTFIGVDASDARGNALGFLRKDGVTYPTVYDAKGIYGGIATHWQVASLPQTWLLGKDGTRSLRIPRPTTETELAARINQLLGAA